MTDEQYNIITASKDSNLRIIACAGSGKTTTICCRVKYLLDIGIDPSKIIILTFNVEASYSIKNKIFEIVNREKADSLVIGNIDKIAATFYYKYFKKY